MKTHYISMLDDFDDHYFRKSKQMYFSQLHVYFLNRKYNNFNIKLTYQIFCLLNQISV